MTARPLETRDDARNLPAVQAAYEAMSTGTMPGAECNRVMMREACRGVDLGAFDRHVLMDWLAGWEPHVVGTLASVMERIREAGRQEGTT